MTVASLQPVPVIEVSRVVSALFVDPGRLVIADGVENRIFLIEIGSGIADTLESTGSGPNEIQGVSSVMWDAPDSVAAHDSRAGRFAILALSPLRVSRTVSVPPGLRTATAVGGDTLEGC